MKLIRLTTALAVFLSLFILTASCSTAIKSKKNDLLATKYSPLNTENEQETLHPIIRLKRDGKFFCSGFVIDDNYAVTAAHCVSSNLVGFPALDSSPITVATVDDVDQDQKVYAAGLNSRQDYAILKGDFHLFKKMQIDAVNPPILYSQGPLYRSCGFPMGQKQLICVDVMPVGNEYFHIMGKGFEGLYPGMSGGPLIDMETMKVVAVNSYAAQGYCGFGPLIGMLAYFGIE